jgi:hypothetical protein
MCILFSENIVSKHEQSLILTDIDASTIQSPYSQLQPSRNPEREISKAAGFTRKEGRYVTEVEQSESLGRHVRG